MGSIVEMRMFGGFTYADIADCLGLTEKKVEHSLQAARAWLRERLSR